MTLAAFAHQTYQNATRETAGPREMEARVFRQIADRLVSAARTRETAPGPWHEALSDNTTLWTIIKRDLENPSNSLPLDLKNSLYSLATFSIRHTQAVMHGNADINVLVDLNRTMADGLRASSTSSDAA